jgi:cell division protein FtsL
MGVVKFIYYIRLYGIPDFLVLWTSYSAVKEIRTMDEGLNTSLRVFTLIVGAIYMMYRIFEMEIKNRIKVLDMRIKEEELRKAELDNQLKEIEIKQKQG